MGISTLYTYNYSNLLYIKYPLNYTLKYIDFEGVLNTKYNITHGESLTSISEDISNGELGVFQYKPKIVSAWADGLYEYEIIHKTPIEIVLQRIDNRYISLINGPRAEGDFLRIKQIEIVFSEYVTEIVYNKYWKSCTNEVVSKYLCIYQEASVSIPWNTPFLVFKTVGIPLSFSVTNIDIQKPCINCIDFILTTTNLPYLEQPLIVSNTYAHDVPYHIYNYTDLKTHGIPFRSGERLFYFDDQLNLFIDTLIHNNSLYLSYTHIYYLRNYNHVLLSFPNIGSMKINAIDKIFKYMKPSIGDSISDFEGRSSFWNGNTWEGRINYLNEQTGYKLYTRFPRDFICEGWKFITSDLINITKGWSWHPIKKNTSLTQYLSPSILESYDFPLFALMIRVIDFNTGIISSYYKGSSWTLDMNLVSGHAIIIFSKFNINLIRKRRRLSSNNFYVSNCYIEPFYPLSHVFFDKTFVIHNVNPCEEISIFKKDKKVGRGIVYSRTNKTYVDIILYTDMYSSFIVKTKDSICKLDHLIVRC